MKKQYIVIPLAISSIGFGLYIMSYSVKAEYFVGRSWMEAQTELLATDYYIGMGFFVLGLIGILTFVWQNISSKNKRRKGE